MLADAEDDSFLFTDECFDGADHLGLEQMPEADISIISDVCSQGGTPTVDAKILDGAVIVQMLPPKLANTFQDYADNVFLPYIMRQLETVKRLDVVWDIYVTQPQSCYKKKEGIWYTKESDALSPHSWKLEGISPCQ
ncbi:hypothetical protein ACOMHN_049340 [Nucella lapillus]